MDISFSYCIFTKERLSRKMTAILITFNLFIGSLLGLFSQVKTGGDEIRDRAIKFLHLKMKTGNMRKLKSPCEFFFNLILFINHSWARFDSQRCSRNTFWTNIGCDRSKFLSIRNSFLNTIILLCSLYTHKDPNNSLKCSIYNLDTVTN